MYHRQAILLGLSLAFTLVPFSQVKAQLLPDNTLGIENSVITPMNSLEDKINGGAIRGNNLFHSFKEFNIDSARSVFFNNPANIQNILTRVTGSNQSQILGKLGVSGNANLYFINPNGIIFGKDSSLDVNASFIGSAASSINFADGTEFSAVLSENKPLLTISAPVGLGMENNLAQAQKNTSISQVISSDLGSSLQTNTQTLEVQTEKGVVLVGGDILSKLRLVLLTSKFGNIDSMNVASGLILSDYNQQIIPKCGSNNSSSFTVSGRGGLPESPNQLFRGNIILVDLIDLVPASKNQQNSISSISIIGDSIDNSNNNPEKEIVEAKGWMLDAQGNIEFVAEVPNFISNSTTISRPDCQTFG